MVLNLVDCVVSGIILMILNITVHGQYDMPFRFSPYHQSEFSIAVGTNENITCTPYPDPTPIISWYKNGQHLVNNETYHIYNKGSSSNLQITIREADVEWVYGIYTCFVSYGLNSAWIDLNVQQQQQTAERNMMEVNSTNMTTISSPNITKLTTVAHFGNETNYTSVLTTSSPLNMTNYTSTSSPGNTTNSTEPATTSSPGNTTNSTGPATTSSPGNTTNHTTWTVTSAVTDIPDNCSCVVRMDSRLPDKPVECSHIPFMIAMTLALVLLATNIITVTGFLQRSWRHRLIQSNRKKTSTPVIQNIKEL